MDYINTDNAIQKLLDSYQPDIRPLWNCSSTTNTSSYKKLIFVHIYKTAGSTFREFLLNYASRCHRGCAVIARCSGLMIEYNEMIRNRSNNSNKRIKRNATYWKNGYGREKGKTCIVQSVVYRNDTIVMNYDQPITNQFVQNHVDILVGHIPVNVHSNWEQEQREENEIDTNTTTAVTASTATTTNINRNDDENSQHYQYGQNQYVTFLRDPIDKYISGFLYATRHTHTFNTVSEIIESIQTEIHERYINHRFYEGYTAYLLSPSQKSILYNNSNKRRSNKRHDSRRRVESSLSSSEERVQERTHFILSNLIHYNFLIGIVESMNESLQLIQYVIDGQYELTPFFQFIGMHETIINNRTMSSSKRLSPSSSTLPLSTTTSEQQQGQRDPRSGGVYKSNESKRIPTFVVVDALLQNSSTTYQKLQSILKYDYMIYNFGRKIHEKQYQWLMGQTQQ